MSDIKRLIFNWNKAKLRLTRWKAEEMKWRKLVAETVFTSPNEGVNKEKIGNSAELKLQHKLNYSIDASDFSKLLSVIERIGALEGTEKANALFKWSCDLRVAEFRGLNDPAKLVLSEVLTITQAAPTLTLNDPKGTFEDENA